MSEQPVDGVWGLEASEALKAWMSDPRRVNMDILLKADLRGMSQKTRTAWGTAYDMAYMQPGEFYQVWHRGGVPYNEASLPRWWHRCVAQTNEWFGLSQLLHCACGAAMENMYRTWEGKNQRRKRTR